MRQMWVSDAAELLVSLRSHCGGWSYRSGLEAASEPTSFAILALRLFSETAVHDKVAITGARWVASIQNEDGSVGPWSKVRRPGWPTALAVLAWEATGGFESNRDAAIGWLLRCKGKTLSRGEDPSRIAGHDTSLVGWPWVVETHSWLEPTAYAVLALRGCGFGEHARVKEGLDLIRDRETSYGGWNYGNKAVFGRPLRSQPGPTGLALLALAATQTRDIAIENATGYLKNVLPTLKSSSSLAWAVLGLQAWGEKPEEADERLESAFEAFLSKPADPMKLALLMMASDKRTTELLGFCRSCIRRDTVGG